MNNFTRSEMYLNLSSSANALRKFFSRIALLFSLVVFFDETAVAGAGFFGSGQAGVVTYSLNGAADVNSRAWGTNIGSARSLILKGGFVHTWKDGSGNICNGKIFYRVYPQGSASGSFTQITLGFSANHSFTTTANGGNISSTNSGDQRWGDVSQSINLAQLATSRGVWVLEVYFQADGNGSGTSGCATTFTDNNSGANYTILFTKEINPGAETGSPLGSNGWDLEVSFGQPTWNLGATVRSGSNSINPVTTTSNARYGAHNTYTVQIPGSGTNYIHALGWFRRSSTISGSPTVTMQVSTTSGTVSSGTGVGATTTFQRATVSASATNGAIYFPRFSISGSSNASYFLDDIIIYTSTSSGVDVTKPNAPTGLTVTRTSTGNNILSWTDGTDVATNTSGIEGTLILRVTGDKTSSLTALNSSILDQAFYSTTSTVGPTTISDGTNTWTVVSNGTSSGSYTDAGAATNVTYVVVMRDKAYNYSAGVLAYSNCVNPTNGGTISAAQNICINATPSPFTSSAAASGNSGTLEYKWQSSTTSASSGFSDISGATSAAYTPGSAISQTTWYKRLARVSCMSDWTGAAESNVLTVAVDQSNAAATTYNSSWASSQDDGTTGLNSWVLITSGTSGHFTGSSDINVSGRSWAMYASSSGQANAIRPFTSSMSVGSTLRFSIDNGFVQTGGTVGFSLRNSSSQNLMEFYFSGGQSNYTISDNAGASATTIPYSTSGFNIAITYTAANTYSMSVTPAAGGTTVYFTGRTFSATGGSQVPKEIRFFNANAGSGSSYDYFINSISLNRPAIGGETNFAAQTVCSSAGAATLSVAGYSGSSYQWYRNTSATTSGASTVGTNSASYTPTDIGTTYYYYCVVSGTCANAQSNFSGAVLINQSPTITLTNNTTSVCSGPATVNYAYSATLGSPNQYSIDWDATANTDGLSDVTNATLPLSQISVSVPSVDVYKVYTGTLTVRNSTTGCVSGTYALTLTVNGIPTISLNAIADICQGTTTASLGYSTGSSTHYTIDFNAAANTAGFTDIGTATVLPATPSGSISISVPGGVAAGTYSATLTPSNNGTGCTGTGYSISITVNPTTNITVETNFGAQTLCSAESASALSVTATGVGLSYQWYQNTSASTVGATPVGTNSDTYTPPSTVGTYYYYCVVSGTCSNDQSSFSGAITFNTTPTITLTSNTASTCSGPANVNFAYSATTGTPNQYSIDFNGAANTAGFSDVTNASLTGTPIVVSVPGAGTGVYNGTLTVRNSTTGCVSGTYSISITINGNPSISLGSDPVVCFGTTSTTLSYSTGSSDEYKIDYDGAANSAGFTDVSYTSLPGSPLTLTIPGGAAAAVYNATLTVRNSGTGCESAGYPVTLTVTAIPTITSAGHNSRCGTGTVQLGAVASAGTINWYTASSGGSSINTGINYTTPSISSTTTYYVDATINGCTTGSRTAVTATVNTVNTWDGTTGDWNDGTKWSCGSAPDGSTNVVIPGGTVTLNTLFEVPSGKTLTLTGGSLIIDPGVQLIVTGTADFGGRPVTIRSTSSGNGSIGIIGNNGSNLTGATSVTVERYIPGRRAWRGLSVPLKTSSGSQSIYSQWQNGGSVIANTGVLLWNPSGTGGFNQNSTSGAGTNLRSYGVSAFSTPTSTTSAVLFNTSGPVPYLVFVTDQHRSGANVGNMVTGFGNTTLKATGVLYTGNYTKSGLASGIHMIPNPYPSQLEFTGATRTNVNNKFWVWDPLLGGSYTGGGYQSYSNGVFAPGGASYSGISGTNTQIAAGGAFWIESTGSGEISFDEVDKTTGNLRPFRLGSQTEILNINMTNIEGDIMYDGVAAAYNNEASVNNDAMDTKKFSLGTENISIVRFNEHYSIEFRPLIDSKDTIYLRLHKMQQKRYQLVLAAQNFSLENGLIATLQDLYLNQEMPLSLSGKSEYSFEVGENVASAENRFRIVFRTSAITPVREITSLKNVSMYPNPISKSGTIQIDFKNQIPGRYTLKVFNVLGVQVHNDFVVHNGGSFIHKLVLPGSLKAGSYIAEILSEKGERKQFKLTIY